MIRIGRILTLSLAIALGGAALLWAPKGQDSRGAAHADAASGDIIAVNSRGIVHNESTDPDRILYTTPLYSLTNGAEVGSATFNNFCSATMFPTCAVYEVVATFRLPQGESRPIWSRA